MALQAFGKIHRIYDTQQISENFRKREFVLTTDEQYPQQIKMELQHDNVDLLDNLKIGDSVTVHINLRGRAWINPADQKENFFNTIIAWKIEPIVIQQPSAPIPSPQTAPEQSTAFPNDDDEPDDLPF